MKMFRVCSASLAAGYAAATALVTWHYDVGQNGLSLLLLSAWFTSPLAGVAAFGWQLKEQAIRYMLLACMIIVGGFGLGAQIHFWIGSDRSGMMAFGFLPISQLPLLLAAMAAMILPYRMVQFLTRRRRDS